MTDQNTVLCSICQKEVDNFILPHLQQIHGMDVQKYLNSFPDARLISLAKEQEFLLNEKNKKIERQHPPPPDQLERNLCGIPFKVYHNVPKEACLILPPHYRFPTSRSGTKRNLYSDVKFALIAMAMNRSLYIHGLPGAGKDALVHAVSALTRRPGIIRNIKPGADIQSWFFSRELGEKGTFWTEGPLLKALRDGYGPDKIPYIVLISDLDRAEPSQVEYLRLILDSIQGRIEGPEGKSHTVLPGTLIVATGNTSGSGDSRGRAISAQVMDATILDRFDRCFQFHWMDWEDEKEICKNKFPFLHEKIPEIFVTLSKVTTAVRDSILDDALYAEFSHRAVCQILEHAQDLISFSLIKDINPNWLFKQAIQTWLDKLPDEETLNAALAAIGPHISGGMEETERIQTEPSGGISGWA